MATILERRQSRPKVVIPSKEDVQDIPTPPRSGSLSPILQPNTPPVLPSNNPEQILQIGKYLLVELVDTNVYKALNTQNGQEKICKVFSQESYRSKIAAYCRVQDDANVVEINEIIQGDKMVYVFFDKHYGDLHSYVRTKKKLKEEETVQLFRQIAESVAQCHMCGIVIRDLKLKKFVFSDPERTRIQLEGLEDSYVVREDNDDTLRDKQGCPAYVSPEILGNAKAGYSGKASDQWSSGVMLYTMLVGRYPFHESEPTKLFEKIRLGSYTIPNSISAKAKCLIRNLLRREPSERLTAEEVLEHPWFKSPKFSFVSSSKESSLDQLVPSL